MTTTNVAAAVTALTAALVLTACGGQENTTPAGPAPASTSAAAAHTDADVTFAQGMIPHHQQAIEMSRLAAGRGGPDVRRLATTIEQAQDPEITRLRGFLAAWGAPERGGMPGADHGGHGAMAHGGMMTPEQMQELERSSGAAFDRAFLSLMIDHHEGAVRMARAELSDGADPGARALAQRIVDAQQSEIAEMRRMLG